MEYRIGNVVTGKVAGIQPYGVFVSLDNQTQGLIHISELQHGFVENVDESFRLGDEVEVMVLDVDEYTKKVSLSMRTLSKPKNAKRFSKKKVPRYGLRKDIGFRSLGNQLLSWVEEAKRDEEKGIG